MKISCPTTSATPDPSWCFTSDIGNEVFIDANTGEAQVIDRSDERSGKKSAESS